MAYNNLPDTLESVSSEPLNRASHFNPLHGGDIVRAAAHYTIALDQWADLSTGINPTAYPVASVAIATCYFQQLPYIRPEFIAASSAYYQADHFIAVTGTQAAIQQLPYCLADLSVLIPQVGYQEHRRAWIVSGAKVNDYPSLYQHQTMAFIDEAIGRNPQQHLVIINPNNPTGVLFEPAQLLLWANKLAPKAMMIIDEAFVDTTPAQSMLTQPLPDNVIVLRSLGKFFGLAGIRLGYCFASAVIREQLTHRLGLWQVNGPAQAIAIAALNDQQWQTQAMIDIQKNARCTHALLLPLISALYAQPLFNTATMTTLFLSYQMTRMQALAISQHFAQAGILLRVIELPATESDGSASLANTNALLRIGLVKCDDKVLQHRLRGVVNAFLSLSLEQQAALVSGAFHV